MGDINELKGFTRGQIDAALMKIGHDVGMETREAIEAFLRGELTVKMTERVWNTWMTINLGTFSSVKNLRKAINKVVNWSNHILNRPTFTINKFKQEIELIKVSVYELGFKSKASYGDIRKRALELGLSLCPAEVGPQLRLQYKEQLIRTSLIVAMDPILDVAGNFNLFRVGCAGDGVQYLDTCDGYSKVYWDIDERFVFIRRKSA